MLTNQLSLCVIAVDWSGYPSQEHHVLRASLICDGRSISLLSWVVPSKKQQNSMIQKAFLDALAGAVNPQARVLMQDPRMPGSGMSNHSAGILSVVSEVIANSGWTKKASTGSGGRNYPPVTNLHIWDRGRWPVQNMPVVTVIFICIKRKSKGDRINVHVAGYHATRRNETDVQQPKNRGLFSAVQMTLSRVKS
nr:transposase [Yersinia frederiksenii]